MFGSFDRLDFDTDGKDWPHRDRSLFERADDITFHVQEFGDNKNPKLLLVHGTGASTHSWRDCIPLLEPHFHILTFDLPGHAFTSMPAYRDLGINGMSRAIGKLLTQLSFAPDIAIGHSAGAVILIQMSIDRRIFPRQIMSLNGALLPFDGVAGQIFPPIAKMLFINPFVPRLFALGARNRSRVESLLEGTGSKLSSEGLDLYGRLFANPGHVAGALGMMANWDLDTFSENVEKLTTPTILFAAENDKTIPPRVSQEVAERATAATYEHIAALGHLAHEEDPATICDLILARADLVPAEQTG